jgi:hypothetical protein
LALHLEAERVRGHTLAANFGPYGNLLQGHEALPADAQPTLAANHLAPSGKEDLMFRLTRRRGPAAVAAICALLALAAAANASAATLYVNNEVPVVAGGKSCAQPPYNKVQSAISAAPAGSTINVCSGTYTEQLTVEKALKLIAINGAGTATVVMPATPANATSECDTKIGPEQRDEISICTPGTVTITNLNVEAEINLETCGGGLDGIFIGGGGTLKATTVSVNGASTTNNGFKGCQHGIAIVAGTTHGGGEVGHMVLNGVTVTGYQKNGPTAVEAGSTLIMNGSKVTGAGPSPYIAQNGVEVAFGAKGTVSTSSVAGNECNVGSCGATGEQASGVLFFESAIGSKVSGSTVKENDLGAYYASGRSTVAAKAEFTLTGDVLTSNRFEGVLLEEGKALLSSDTINGSGRVGIDLFQFEGQKSASESTASKNKIEGQAESAIKVESDKKAGDIAGKFTFANGTATGNGNVLINESNNFEVVF